MTTGKKIVGVSALLGLWYWWTLQPKIKVLQIINLPVPSQETFAQVIPGIVFEMSIDGYSIKDTVYANDQKQVIAAGNGKHFFVSEGSMSADDMGALLSIQDAQGNNVANGYISAYYPQNQLPTDLT